MRNLLNLFCSIDLTSTGWVQSTISLDSPLDQSQLTRQLRKFCSKNLRSRDSIVGQQDEKREHYLRAMPTSNISSNENIPLCRDLNLRQQIKKRHWRQQTTLILTTLEKSGR